MDFLYNIYQKTIIENEKNIKFWEDYIQSLNSLDLSTYSENLTIPILVPIGNRILFRGNLKHTNEVTIALGADYFVKCSIKQAELLRQHRIKGAKSKLEEYYKEKEYLENQLLFSKQNVYENTGQEIIEHCTEEEDRAWRAAHRERVRQYNQSSTKKETTDHSHIDDTELWRRLEELELQEELENELTKNKFNNTDSLDEEYYSFDLNKDNVHYVDSDDNIHEEYSDEVAMIPKNSLHQISKLELLQQVIDRQKILETKLTELKNRDRITTETESDLLSRLEEIEQLEDLEDEIDRLDDILEKDSDVDDNNEDDENVNNFVKKEMQLTPKQIVTFNEDDNETLELNFKHSDIEPDNEPYDNNKGINKPSDIYFAFPHLFLNQTKSIMKKLKYEPEASNIQSPGKQKKNISFCNENIEPIKCRAIMVKDVMEKNENKVEKINTDARPTSLFKKRRQQQKS